MSGVSIKDVFSKPKSLFKSNTTRLPDEVAPQPVAGANEARRAFLTTIGSISNRNLEADTNLGSYYTDALSGDEVGKYKDYAEKRKKEIADRVARPGRSMFLNQQR